MELIFEVRDAEEGAFFARALGHSIFTQGEDWNQLRSNVLEAVSVHFEGAEILPRLAQLHYVKEELIPGEAVCGRPGRQQGMPSDAAGDD